MIWAEIENLEKKWKGPKSVDEGAKPDSNWEPLPGLHPYKEKPQGPPEESLAAEVNNDEPLLSEECANRIKDIWNGEPTIPGHFHCYPITNHRAWIKWRAHKNFPKNGNYWWCSNISSAANHWSWTNFRGGNFEQLSWVLQCAMRQGNPAYAAAVCLKILRWGGFQINGKAIRPSLDWIQGALMAGRLISDLNLACRSLRGSSGHALPNFGPWPNIPMNSGTTKIFSAVGMDFSNGFSNPRQDVLILDGRVGAAMGLMARKIAHNAVPPNLMFPWGPHQSDRLGNNRRNPSCDHVAFQNIHNLNHNLRAEFTKRGARCIQQILGVNGPSSDFILAEKGLFMIGYDVRHTCNIICHGPDRYCP